MKFRRLLLLGLVLMIVSGCQDIDNQMQQNKESYDTPVTGIPVVEESLVEHTVAEDIVEDTIKEEKVYVGDMNLDLVISESPVKIKTEVTEESAVEETPTAKEEKTDMKITESIEEESTVFRFFGVEAPIIDDMSEYTCKSQELVNGEWVIVESNVNSPDKTFVVTITKSMFTATTSDAYERKDIKGITVNVSYDMDSLSGTGFFIIDGVLYKVETTNIEQEEVNDIIELVINKIQELGEKTEDGGN